MNCIFHLRGSETPSENHGLGAKCPERCHGAKPLTPVIDDPAGDSLVEAFEGAEGNIELEPLQSAND